MLRFSILLFAAAVLVVLGIYFLLNQGHRWIPGAVVEWVREPDLLDHPGAERCGECHRDIFEAWKKSRHFRSWTSEFYIKDSDNRAKEKCLPCHIPQEVRAGEKPVPRQWRRDDGVYCAACHVSGGAMQGPYDLFSPPHPTRENPDYRKSKFCGSCHRKTFKEWQAADVGKSCQNCHMTGTDGQKLTQKFPFSWFHSRKRRADHRFPHGEFNEDNLKMDARVKGRSLWVTLRNEGIPHLVPTADNGDPRLYIYVVFLDKDGEELDKFKEILAPQQETALPYRKDVTFDFPLEPGTARAEISIQYKPAWSKEKSTVRNWEIRTGL